MNLQLTPTQVLAAFGALLALIVVWRWSAAKARRAADKARASARAVSLAGRVLVTGGLIVGVQWVVITRPSGSPWLLLVVLALPDLLAAYVLTRALTVTSMDVTAHRGGGRR